MEEVLQPLGVIKSVIDDVVVVQSNQAAPIMNDDSGEQQPSRLLYFSLSFRSQHLQVPDSQSATLMPKSLCRAVLALEGRRVLGPICEIFGRTDAPMYTGEAATAPRYRPIEQGSIVRGRWRLRVMLALD